MVKVEISWKETFFSECNSDFVYPMSATIGDKITINLRVYKINPIKEIYLRCSPFGEELFYPITMKNKGKFFNEYSVTIPVVERVLHYRFFIQTDDKNYWYNKHGILDWNPLDIYDFMFLPGFEKPDWIPEAIFYQIFPDRFYDGDPSNNVKSGEFTVHGKTSKALKWDQLQEFNGENYPSFEFYGGDIEGIKQKIPYLKELGV